MIARTLREAIVTACLLAPLGACALDARGIASGGASGATTTSDGSVTTGAGGAGGVGGAGGEGGGALGPVVTGVKVRLSITHARLGNLTIKLTSPAGTTQTLMSRPGFFESADDGGPNGTPLAPKYYGPPGDLSDLFASDPITFDDLAPTDAEDMGRYLDQDDTGVCRDPDNMAGGSGMVICRYRPSPQAAGGPATLSAAFTGQPSTGAWRLCVGDSDPETAGTLEGWQLEIATSESKQFTALDLGLGIPEDQYNGSFESMVCHSLEVL